jgi:phage-related protein (TIGR01555 family)
MLEKLINLFRPAQPAPHPVTERKNLKVGPSWQNSGDSAHEAIDQAFAAVQHKAYTPPKGVVPEGQQVTGDSMDYSYLNGMFANPDAVFMGYASLSNLAQKSENRVACEQSVNEVFRKGFKIKSNDTDSDRSEIINQLEDAFEKLGVEKHLKRLGFNGEAFGQSHIFVKLKGDEQELSKELMINPTKIKKGDLEGFRVVEPIWCYPQGYNSMYPLKADFFQPYAWFVLGELVDASRMKQLVMYPVPDMLKPSYNFGGLSLIQMMLPYVNNWESVRDDIPRIITTFRTFIWSTGMEAYLQDRSEFEKRLNTLVYGKNNHGVLAIDKAEETLQQMNTSLTGLADLLGQQQKLLCMPSRLSVTSLTGSQPSGMNASGEGESDAQHENIANKQKGAYKPVLDWILKLVCLSEFGDFYEDLYIDFNPLDEMSDKEIAEINKLKADTYSSLVQDGIITPEQANSALASDDDSGFNGIKYEAVPEIDLGLDEGVSDEDKDPPPS